jgi:hypothetical protein
MTPTPTDPGDHLELSYSHPLRAPADQVFPLLCPVREVEWIPGWSCRLVHTASGLVERGCVFVTERAGEGTTTWVTTLHDPAARRVEFARFTEGHLVVQMALRVEAAAGGSVLHVRYAVTALDQAGRAHLARARPAGEPYAAVAAGLAEKLDRFLGAATA